MKIPVEAVDCSCRKGVTLIELLIVIAIISIMLSLLFPAIHMVRDSSLRASCQNNHHNLDVAIRSYLDVHKDGFFPAPKGDKPCGWAIEILPFMEGQTIRDSFVMTAPLSDPRNQTAAQKRPPTLVCPLVYYQESQVPGIAAANYVLYIDDSRPSNKLRDSYRLIDASLGSKLPWCYGPEMSISEYQNLPYENPHPATGVLSQLMD